MSGLSSLRRRLYQRYQSRLIFSCKLTSEGRTCGVPWLFHPCLAHGSSIAGQCSNKLTVKPCQPGFAGSRALKSFKNCFSWGFARVWLGCLQRCRAEGMGQLCSVLSHGSALLGAEGLISGRMWKAGKEQGLPEDVGRWSWAGTLVPVPEHGARAAAPAGKWFWCPLPTPLP